MQGQVTDHGGFTGLGDDDHPQYLLIDGSRAMTGALTLADVAGAIRSGDYPLQMKSGELTATNNAFVFDTSVTHSSGKLVDIRNNGTSRLSVDGRGTVDLVGQSWGQGRILNASASHNAFFARRDAIVIDLQSAVGTFASWRGLLLRDNGSQTGTQNAVVIEAEQVNTGAGLTCFRATGAARGFHSVSPQTLTDNFHAQITAASGYTGNMFMGRYAGSDGLGRFLSYDTSEGERFSVDSAGNPLWLGTNIHYLGAIGRSQNLLKWPTQFDKWTLTGTGAGGSVTANNAANPFSGQNTADSINTFFGGTATVTMVSAGHTTTANETFTAVVVAEASTVQDWKGRIDSGNETGTTKNFQDANVPGKYKVWVFSQTFSGASTGAPRIVISNTSNPGSRKIAMAYLVRGSSPLGFPANASNEVVTERLGLVVNGGLIIDSSDGSSRQTIIEGDTQGANPLWRIQNKSLVNQWHIDSSFNLNIADTRNVVLGTGAGTKWGTATTQKQAWFNATPVVQQADTVALTDSTGGTANNTVAAVSGSGDDTTINDNFADLTAKYNALRSLLRTYGLMA